MFTTLTLTLVAMGSVLDLVRTRTERLKTAAGRFFRETIAHKDDPTYSINLKAFKEDLENLGINELDIPRYEALYEKRVRDRLLFDKTEELRVAAVKAAEEAAAFQAKMLKDLRKRQLEYADFQVREHNAQLQYEAALKAKSDLLDTSSDPPGHWELTRRLFAATHQKESLERKLYKHAMRPGVGLGYTLGENPSALLLEAESELREVDAIQSRGADPKSLLPRRNRVTATIRKAKEVVKQCEKELTTTVDEIADITRQIQQLDAARYEPQNFLIGLPKEIFTRERAIETNMDPHQGPAPAPGV